MSKSYIVRQEKKPRWENPCESVIMGHPAGSETNAYVDVAVRLAGTD